MDTDKDNKPPLDVPKDNDPKTEDNDLKNDDNENKDEKQPEKPDIHEDQSPRDQVDDSSPKPPSDKAADQPDPEIKADAEIKEDQEEKDPADDETKLEEDQSPPPPPLDFQKISEEIDQYILALTTNNHSSTPPQDDESNTISTPPQDDVDDKSGTMTTPPQDDGDDKSDTIITPPQDDVDDKSGTITTPPQDDVDDKSGTITTPPQDDVEDKSGTITTPPQDDGDDKSGTITTPPQDDMDDKSGTISTPPQDDVDDESGTITTPPQDDDEDVDVLPGFVEQFVFMVEAKIADHDSIGSPVKWSTLTEEDSDSFIEAIIRLSSLFKSLPTEPKYARSHNRIGAVLQRAMSYIEEEFKSLVEEYKINDSDNNPSPHANANANASASETPTKTNQESSDDHQNPPESPAPTVEADNYFPGYPNEILSSLIKLSKTMMAVGHETECCQVYFVARRNALEHSLHKLGFEKHSIDEVQKMQWESLEREIIAWIGAFKQCATSHLLSERHLCQSVFSDHPAVSDSIFCSLSQCMIVQLLNFAGAVALTKRTIDKIFKFLDVYESLKDTIPKINESFPEEWMSDVTTEASMIRGRIGETIVAIFVELENLIQTDPTKAPPGGAVHPLVRYTMNYLKSVCDGYKATLEQIFREHQKIERADSTSGSDFNYNNQQQSGGGAPAAPHQSPFQLQITKVMDTMDGYLEARSKLYKDHALSSIFMMNNGRYILQKIKASSEINALMGDSWCRKRSTELRQYHKGYQRETWGKLLSSLHPEGLMSNGKIVKPVVKERFKSFNTMFDEIHKTQSTWVVSDEQLQSELRVSISNMVIPAYRSFLGRYGQVFTPGRQTEKYVKYQAEDIETYIDELFDGNAAPQTGRKRQ